MQPLVELLEQLTCNKFRIQPYIMVQFHSHAKGKKGEQIVGDDGQVLVTVD